jgi:hypothetical protein
MFSVSTVKSGIEDEAGVVLTNGKKWVRIPYSQPRRFQASSFAGFPASPLPSPKWGGITIKIKIASRSRPQPLFSSLF